MTKSELIVEVARRCNITLERAAIVVNTIFQEMVKAMQREERIEIRNFGNFVIRHYGGYTGRNPKTGEKVEVPPKRMPFFKVGLDLKRLLNPPNKTG